MITVRDATGSLTSRDAIYRATVDYFLSPVRELLGDPTVSEVMINRFDDIYVERGGRLQHTAMTFVSEDALLSAVRNIAQWVGREIGSEAPILDARLPDGSRLNAIIPPSARRGTHVTIRKFPTKRISLGDLVAWGSLSVQAREFLEICVRLHKNIIVSGGTGTGKTSLLGAVATAIPEAERVIVIEDTSELQLCQPHTLYLEARPGDAKGNGRLTIRQLFINALRMRPDRILVGEVRSGEALDLVQSMISGHSGSLSTVHATSPADALTRLETLSIMSDVNLPIYVARSQVASAIDLVVQVARFTEDGSRRVTKISQLRGLTSEQRYDLQDLMVAEYSGVDDRGRLRTHLVPTGNQPKFAREVYEHGLEQMVRESQAMWGAASNGPAKRM